MGVRKREREIERKNVPLKVLGLAPVSVSAPELMLTRALALVSESSYACQSLGTTDVQG